MKIVEIVKPEPSRLTDDAVHDLMRHCMCEDDALIDGRAPPDSIRVSGIAHDFAFRPARIAEKKADIVAMLAELPEPFHQHTGGGWTFLNACMDKRGNLWTDLHLQMEALFALAIAAGKARWIPEDRGLWSAMPGSMPYVVVLP